VRVPARRSTCARSLRNSDDSDDRRPARARRAPRRWGADLGSRDL